MQNYTDQKSIAAVLAWFLGVSTEVSDFDWDAGTDQLYFIHRTRGVLDAQERDVIRRLRRAGMTWAGVGEVLGISRQAAQQRFSELDE